MEVGIAADCGSVAHLAHRRAAAVLRSSSRRPHSALERAPAECRVGHTPHTAAFSGGGCLPGRRPPRHTRYLAPSLHGSKPRFSADRSAAAPRGHYQPPRETVKETIHRYRVQRLQGMDACGDRDVGGISTIRSSRADGHITTTEIRDPAFTAALLAGLATAGAAERGGNRSDV